MERQISLWFYICTYAWTDIHTGRHYRYTDWQTDIRRCCYFFNFQREKSETDNYCNCAASPQVIMIIEMSTFQTLHHNVDILKWLSITHDMINRAFRRGFGYLTMKQQLSASLRLVSNKKRENKLLIEHWQNLLKTIIRACTLLAFYGQCQIVLANCGDFRHS